MCVYTIETYIYIYILNKDQLKTTTKLTNIRPCTDITLLKKNRKDGENEKDIYKSEFQQFLIGILLKYFLIHLFIYQTHLIDILNVLYLSSYKLYSCVFVMTTKYNSLKPNILRRDKVSNKLKRLL